MFVSYILFCLIYTFERFYSKVGCFDFSVISTGCSCLTTSSDVHVELLLACSTSNQTWAQDTFKISSSRPSNYFYIQDKNQVLCSLRKTSSSKNFMCQSSANKQNENQAIQALSKKTQRYRVLILLAG